MTHVPVLLDEAVAGLHLSPGNNVIDGTLGNGGHAAEILTGTAPDGRLLGIDRDPHACRTAAEHLASFKKRVTIVTGNYADMEEHAAQAGFTAVHGILLDLGIRSDQLETSGRGFSFQRDEPLLMTMDGSQQETAAHVVNAMTQQELVEIISAYGEEPQALRIVKAIIMARKAKRITTSGQLADIISAVVPRRGKIHPATRTFQALRIVVNDELGALERGIASAQRLLAPGGRLAIISFHSLEDRIVKRAFQKMVQDGAGSSITKKPIIPSFTETKTNPRSRSAKLRVFQKHI